MSDSKLQAAYYALGIDNGVSLSDEDIGVAFYRGRFINGDLERKNAMYFIAEARQSRFLRFLATIGEHLNEKNIAVLAKKTFSTLSKSESSGEESIPIRPAGKIADAGPESEHVGEEFIGAKPAEEGPSCGESSQSLASESSERGIDVDTFGEHCVVSEDS